MDSRGRRHPFEVLDYYGERVEIDVEIVPLIRAIWALGFDTELSCQDDDGYVSVALPGKHAQRVLNAIAAADRELRANILGLVPIEVEDPEDFYAYQRAHAWRFSVGALSDPDGVWLEVGVRFPRSQLPAVVAALERMREVA